MKKFQKPKRYESFKMDLGLMNLIRKYAREDNRSIKATIEVAMREGFKARKPDAQV